MPEARSAGQPGAPWLYVPWLREHGDALVESLAARGGVKFAPVHLFPPDNPDARRSVAVLAHLKPERLRAAIERRLLRAAPRAAGLLLTFDWTPAMRILVEVARAQGLPVVLVPHEGVFLSRGIYYGGAPTVPVADRALLWGELQRSIFAERGFPAERMALAGSPKLWGARAYRPRLDPAEWQRLSGHPPGKPIVLFAVQPLDNVADPAAGRAAQRRAISDAAAACAALGALLLVRAPPADLPGLLPDPLPAAAVPRQPSPAVQDMPHETLAHSAMVISIGSTMLIEAAAMGRPCLSVAYDGSLAPFEGLGIGAARNAAELHAAISQAIAGSAGAAPAQGLEALAEAYGFAAANGDPAPGIAAELARLARPVDLAAKCGAARRGGRDAIDWFIAFERLGLPPKLRKLLLRPGAFLRDLALLRR